MLSNSLKLPEGYPLIDENFELELQRFVYKKSYYEFFKAAFVVLHSKEAYNDNWHIKLLCDKLQLEAMRIAQYKVKKKDIIINVPFRSSKSLICSVMFLPWCWITYPHLKFIYVSYSSNLALEHAQLSKNLINSEWYKRLWGTKFKMNKAEDAKHFYVNDSGGFRKSVGTGGQITGSGADILCVDDGQNPKRAASEKERKNTIDFWDHTLYSRLNQPEIGVRINIQQRLHEDDLTGHLLKTNAEQYELIKIPAELNEKSRCIPEKLSENYDCNLFWLTRFSKKILDNYLGTLGSLQYAGQLQQLPAPEEGNLMKRRWFDIVAPETILRNIDENPLFFFIDTSETEKTQGDYTAICTCFKKDNCLYIMDVVQYKLAFYKSCEFIKDYVYKMGYMSNSKVKIEPKTAGKSIVNQLKMTTQLNIMEIKMPVSERGKQDDKLTRLVACQPSCESKRVILIEGSYIDRFLDQLCTFPNAEHDDMVDVFVYAIHDLLLGSDFDFSFI